MQCLGLDDVYSYRARSPIKIFSLLLCKSIRLEIASLIGEAQKPNVKTAIFTRKDSIEKTIIIFIIALLPLESRMTPGTVSCPS